MSTPIRPSSRWNPEADPTAVAAFLQDLGYLGRLPGTDAAEADSTRAALRLFQAVAGIEVDGVAGPKTVHALARVHRAWLDAHAFAA